MNPDAQGGGLPHPIRGIIVEQQWHDRDWSVAIAILALVLAGIAITIWLWKRKRKVKALTKDELMAVILRNLESPTASLLSLDQQESHLTSSSHLAREFLQVNYSIKALESTTEELKNLLARVAPQDADELQHVTRFLEFSDRARFERKILAEKQISAEFGELATACRGIVAKTNATKEKGPQ